MLPNSQSACGLACGARTEDCDAGLDYECCFLPRTSDSTHGAMVLRGRLILAFLRVLVGAFKAAKLSSPRTLVSAGGYGM
jgi:hypothetical protein